MNRRRVFKWTTLTVIAVGAAWLLRPPEKPGMPDTGSDEPARTRTDRSRRHVIRIAPGQEYLPGAIPHGVGEPLNGLNLVIADFEARFPDTRVVVVNSPVSVREYLVTQLSSGAAPDIVNVNVEDVWVDTQKGWYVPLDEFLEAPNPFVVEKGVTNAPGTREWWDMFRYQAVSRGKAAPDGKNYCLSLDMVETGIYYNKTIFAELGLSPPEDWEEFMTVCRRIEPTGRTPLLLHMGCFVDWGQDLFFDQLYYGLLPGIDLKQDPSREAYLRGYLDSEELAYLHGKGFFTHRDPRYRELWRIMRELKQYSNRDIDLTDYLREFVTQRAVMLWHSSTISYRLIADKKLGFDWGIFYLPPFTTDTTEYASGVDMCVIGGAATQLEVTNSSVRDTPADWPMDRRIRESERLKHVIAFLQFLCLPEQTERVVNEYPCFVANIVGVDALAELAAFERILERRYTTTKWAFSFDLRFSDILQRMLALYLTDGVDLDEFMEWQVNNVTSSCENMLGRKSVDMARLEAKWRELAPKRRGFTGLPEEE